MTTLERIKRISFVTDKINQLQVFERTIKKHSYIHLGHQLDWLGELHDLLYWPELSVFHLPTSYMNNIKE